MFEMNLIMLRRHLDVFIDVCGLPDQYKKFKLTQSWLLYYKGRKLQAVKDKKKS